MPTPLQVLANRRNAAKSTGPRTPRGKAIARLNAVRHGIHASLPVLAPGERRGTWEKFAAAILRDLQPLGAIETLWAGRIALLQWRLIRCAEARQTLADQQWREAVITAPQSAWWQHRRENQGALPGSVHDLRKFLRENRRHQSLVAKLTSADPHPAGGDPHNVDPDSAVDLIEWAATHLSLADHLSENSVNSLLAGAGPMPRGNPRSYQWTNTGIRQALTELAAWANTTLDGLLATLMPALKETGKMMRRKADRADREVRRFRRVAAAQATHESQNADRCEADLERRLQFAMHQLRALQHERAEERVMNAENPPETSAQTRTGARQTP